MRDFMTELLIIKPSSLGDIVHGLQVATSLKAQHEKLRISWIVRDIFAPIVRACAAVDQVYVFERNAGTKGFLRLMREVRQTKFDYVFDMQGLLRTGLMTSRALAKKQGRVAAMRASGRGFSTTRRCRCRPTAAAATRSTSCCSSVPCSGPSPSCAAS
jgi:heptosyltransferase-1